MKTVLVAGLLSLMCPQSFRGQALPEDWPDSTPAEVYRIDPQDVEQASIEQLRIGTNKFIVKWTYTEAGANKMVAFYEAHVARKACMAVGSFVTPAQVVRQQDGYAKWKQGWLKVRTSKVFGITEEDARAIVEGLRKK